ncbi:phage tail assembly chaperone [Atlantibacter hermannii]|uniref:phage tail assembly chaperone n=1 Tax=Atlantibacter hermannii TaxID=565 RepID=UPI00289F0ADE|nr:phage tail assembly chaperone [Atlantibacter hermannii]
MAQKTSQNSLRNMALTASKAYRTKSGVTVPEWDDAKVTLREPSGDAWVKFREILNPDVTEGEEPLQLTEAQKFMRNKEADVVLFIDVLLDENGNRVFSYEDQKVVSEIYGPVHARLLAQAINLGISQEEAGKP